MDPDITEAEAAVLSHAADAQVSLMKMLVHPDVRIVVETDGQTLELGRVPRLILAMGVSCLKLEAEAAKENAN